jgi:hypothetical protein
MYRSLSVFFLALFAFCKAQSQNYGRILQSGGYIQVQGAADTGSTFRVTNVADAELFRVLGNGNIGIGTNSPQAKLAVNGDIFSKRVKVTPTGWPDYVFGNEYRLLPLSQIEDYILLHKHLPGIVTEQEVRSNGVDLGDNQAALLKKIEELTLYLIQQNKALQEQNDRLRQQEIEIARLKEIINKH